MQSKKQAQRRPWFVQGLALVLIGLLMLCGALWFVLRNQEEDARAAQAATDSIAMLESILETAEALPVPEESVSLVEPEMTPGATKEADAPAEVLPLTKMEVDGDIYVGYLVIPSLDRKLPIMELRYLEQLQIAPCLQTGSPHSDDAVICAHNYPSHFGPLRDFVGGEDISFVDLNGVEIGYKVSLVKTISPSDTQEVLDSPHDLVLYTCTTGGQNRVMIACDRAE